MYDKTKVDVIGFNELPSIVSKFIGNNMVIVDRGKIEAINKQLKCLLTKNHLYSDVLHNANIEASKILAKTKENSIYEANNKKIGILNMSNNFLNILLTKHYTVAKWSQKSK